MQRVFYASQPLHQKSEKEMFTKEPKQQHTLYFLFLSSLLYLPVSLFSLRGLNIFHFCIFHIFLLLICFLIKLLLGRESSTSGSFDQAPITF